MRIAGELEKLMRAEPDGAPALSSATHGWLRAVTSPPMLVRQAAQRRARAIAALQRFGTIAVAVLVVAMATLASASGAAARALPESPLYTVKLAEEATLMGLSWNDESKGQTLLMIASHRLGDSAQEADQRHTVQAHRLMTEFRTTLTQAVDLAAHAKAMHEDTSALTSGIQSTLDEASTLASQASQRGDTDYSAAALASVASVSAYVGQVGITLPPKSSSGKGHDGKGNGSDHNGDQGGNQNGGQSTPDPKSTHVTQGEGGAATSTPQTPEATSTKPTATPSNTTPTARPSGNMTPASLG